MTRSHATDSFVVRIVKKGTENGPVVFTGTNFACSHWSKLPTSLALLRDDEEFFTEAKDL